MDTQCLDQFVQTTLKGVEDKYLTIGVPSREVEKLYQEEPGNENVRVFYVAGIEEELDLVRKDFLRSMRAQDGIDAYVLADSYQNGEVGNFDLLVRDNGSQAEAQYEIRFVSREYATQIRGQPSKNPAIDVILDEAKQGDLAACLYNRLQAYNGAMQGKEKKRVLRAFMIETMRQTPGSETKAA